jgi:biopolymer transport protein ExbB
MRWLILVATAAGCSFNPSTATEQPPGSEPDAMPPTGADASTSADGPVAPFVLCPDDDNLVGCYSFEGDIADRSKFANDAAGAGHSFDTGMAGMALRADASTEVTVANAASLQFPADQMSFEAWIFPDEIPTSGRVGIVDQDGGPSIFIYAGGDVQCFAGGRRIGTGTGAVSAGAWVHVACTYLNDTTKIYVDGVPVVDADGGGAVTPGSIGLSIAGNSPSGEPFVGRVDSLRVWRVARTQEQICEAAGCP